MIREELLKKDEEKLREMELKVQKEIEAKRRELLLKEQSLRDLEQKLQSNNESGGTQ
jgi:cell division control protein 11